MNMFGDLISVIDFEDRSEVECVELGLGYELMFVEFGEMLFYEVSNLYD